MTAPRVYCILARQAAIALVFRRGPSDWFHLLRWDLSSGAIEPGVWVRKKLFPRRCDLSDDGQLLLYSISGGYEKGYQVFCGVSRAPWLHPLAQWEEKSTLGSAWYFFEPGIDHGWADPRSELVGYRRVSIRRNANVAFVNELRRGWVYAPDCPPRDPGDVWDEKRGVILEKRAGGRLLRLIGGTHIFRPPAIDGLAPRFELCSADQVATLDDACWADWSPSGQLLVATKSGQLRIEEIHAGRRKVVLSHDLTLLKPDPQPAPAWATDAPQSPP